MLHIHQPMGRLVLTSTIAILMVNIVGCATESPSDDLASSESNPEQIMVDEQESNLATTDSERSMYEPLPLPEDGNLVGDDPEKIAVDVFGLSEPVEGNFQEQVSLLEKTDDKAIVTLTQTGLPDDSVEGTRYWLEFMLNEQQQWQLNWAGRQVRCYPGRGSQTWNIKTCS